MVDVDQDAGKARGRSLFVHVHPTVRFNPAESAVALPDPIFAPIRTSPPQSLGDRLSDARPVGLVDRIHEFAERRPDTHAFRIHAKRSGEALIPDEAILGYVPDPGSHNGARIEGELDTLGLGPRFGLA